MLKRTATLTLCAGLLLQACQARAQEKSRTADAARPAPAASASAKPSDAQLRQRLTPLQYQVTQHEATEQPFHNAYWDNHEAGIYVDVVSGEPLFSSTDKFNSGTGWPSFFQPVAEANVTTERDLAYGMVRTEILCARCDAHLGHVFDDGPAPTRLRFCVNSESLAFTDQKDLATLADPAAA